ncbi:MAG: hypothetical protein DA408_00905 [Bacteroidetes bacterium]|nr:MAG: hypothetical protein C7N36_04695 [Bacteroidota bacterium]PTM14881.1 MAG: hypothetical protein DA408_00905 [Bacteroidota bacterium]
MCPPPDSPTSITTFSLPVSKGTILVHTYGSGPKLLIALHGYDYDGQVFADWAAPLGSRYTICAPDLPFHGGSEWWAPEFKPADWVEIISGIAAQQGKTRYSLVGHSLGGRIIVCTAAILSEQIEQAVLLAPAGIGAFDQVAPLVVQQLAERATGWTRGLQFLVTLGARLGWVSTFHRRYAEAQLYPPDKRYRLFRTYNSIRNFRTTAAPTLQFWQATTLPTLIVLGSNDRFVPNPKIRAYFAANPACTVVEIVGTHDLVNATTAQLLKGRLPN